MKRIHENTLEEGEIREVKPKKVKKYKKKRLQKCGLRSVQVPALVRTIDC
jgi:hypothetical protein